MQGITTAVRKPVYQRPGCLIDELTHYCPGCGHGIMHRILAELIDELAISERTIGIAPVGCAVLAYDYIDIDWCEAAHGRPPAVATGIKRVQPDRVVFTYQGDGDLASIGMAETIHAASRGENITVIFINNAVYAMTQGQMAPTTMIGQVTTTTPRGRNQEEEGPPINVCELLRGFSRVRLLARTTVNSPENVRITRRLLKKALQYQIDGVGFSLIEVLSPCPTYWRKKPADCNSFIETTMSRVFPLGTFRDDGDAQGRKNEQDI